MPAGPHTSARRVTGIMVVWLVLLGYLDAQITISGTVTDTRGASVAFVNVYVEDVYDGSATDEEGRFSFTTEATGELVIVASSLGYETATQRVIPNGMDVVVNLVLQTGATELNEVVIAAGTFEASDESKATILSPLDIVQNPVAAGDLYGAIQTFPGVAQVGDETGIFVRGGEATETQTIIDGTIVDRPFFSEVPDIPSRGRFNPFLFKGTMFSTGGYSAEYGQALSSVLLLNTQDMPTANSTGLGVNLAGAQLSHTRVWNDRTAILANIGYTNLSPFFNLVPQNRDWIDPPNGGGGAIGLRHKWENGGMLKSYAQYQSGQLALNFENPNIGEPPNLFSSENDNLYWNTSFTGIIKDKWSIYTGLSASHDVESIFVTGFDIEDERTRLQSKMTLGRELGERTFLRFGGEWQWREIYGRFEEFRRRENAGFTALYAETDVKVSEKLAFRLGLRGEHDSFIDQMNVAPRSSIAYKTGKRSQVSLAYGLFHQTPQFDLQRGFDDLTFESASHFILNYQWLTENYTFRIEAYHKDYDDLVRYRSDFIGVNDGSGYATGIDIFWRDRKTVKNVDYWISYSLIDAQRYFKFYPEPSTPDFITTHTLNFVSKYQATARLTFGFGYTFASPRAFEDPTRPGFLDGRTDAYHNMVVNGSYLTQLFGNFTVVYVSLSNPFDWDQVFDYRYSQDGSNRVAVDAAAGRALFFGCFILFQ